jgi:hypothetical protein
MKKREIHWSSTSSESEQQVSVKEQRQIVMTSGSLSKKEERKKAQKSSKKIVINGPRFVREINFNQKKIGFGGVPGELFMLRKGVFLFSAQDFHGGPIYVNTVSKNEETLGTIFTFLFLKENKPFFLSGTGIIFSFGDAKNTIKVVEKIV